MAAVSGGAGCPSKTFGATSNPDQCVTDATKKRDRNTPPDSKRRHIMNDPG